MFLFHHKYLISNNRRQNGYVGCNLNMGLAVTRRAVIEITLSGGVS